MIPARPGCECKHFPCGCKLTIEYCGVHTPDKQECPRCSGRPERLKCGPGCACFHHDRLGDRRKGERRMVCRRVLDRQIIIIKPDRRSGKDRRK